MLSTSKVEPLYRFLRQFTHDAQRASGGDSVNPIQAIIAGANELVRLGLARNTPQDGRIIIVESKQIEDSIKEDLAYLVPEQVCFHPAYQAIGKTMQVSLSRVNRISSKTALSLHINEDDTVIVDFIEPDTIINDGLDGREIYSSLSTMVEAEDGTISRGFVRCVSKFFYNSDTDKLVFEANFKTIRAAPFHVMVSDICSTTPNASIGTAAKSFYKLMESQWTA